MKRLLWLVILVGVALHAPTLAWQFYVDDYGILTALEGVESIPMQPWSLYDFGSAPGPGSQLFESGGFPFWCDRDWKARFFRPLTSLELWLEHSLFGRNAMLWHVAGLLWLGLLLWLVHRLYRALGLGAGTAIGALALFAVHGSSLVPVGWIANRNSLLAIICIVATLLALLRGRLAGSLVLATLACACKESGITAFALIALVLAVPGWRGPVWSRRRARAGILASAVLAIGYVVFLVTAGYGTRTLFYATPWGDTARWIGNALHHAATDFSSLVTPIAPDLLFLSPDLLPIFLGLAIAVVLPLCVFVWRLVRDHPAASVLGLWILIAWLPQIGAPVSARLLFGASIGSSGLLAVLFSRYVFVRTRASALRRVVAAVLFTMMGPFAAIGLVSGAFLFGEAADLTRRTITEAEVGSADLGRREVFLLNLPSSLAALSALSTWYVETGDREVRFWPMQAGRRAVRVHRVSERVFRIELVMGPEFLTGPIERVFLTEAVGVRSEFSWRTALFDVVGRRDGDRLSSLTVRCREPIDGERFRFLAWKDGAMRRFALPQPGRSIDLAYIPRVHPFVP